MFANRDVISHSPTNAHTINNVKRTKMLSSPVSQAVIPHDLDNQYFELPASHPQAKNLCKSHLDCITGDTKMPAKVTSQTHFEKSETGNTVALEDRSTSLDCSQ